MDQMLVKPMNTEELLRQIEALLVTQEDRSRRPQRAAKVRAAKATPKRRGRARA